LDEGAIKKKQKFSKKFLKIFLKKNRTTKKFKIRSI